MLTGSIFFNTFGLDSGKRHIVYKNRLQFIDQLVIKVFTKGAFVNFRYNGYWSNISFRCDVTAGKHTALGRIRPACCVCLGHRARIRPESHPRRRRSQGTAVGSCILLWKKWINYA